MLAEKLYSTCFKMITASSWIKYNQYQGNNEHGQAFNWYATRMKRYKEKLQMALSHIIMVKIRYKQAHSHRIYEKCDYTWRKWNFN